MERATGARSAPRRYGPRRSVRGTAGKSHRAGERRSRPALPSCPAITSRSGKASGGFRREDAGGGRAPLGLRRGGRGGGRAPRCPRRCPFLQPRRGGAHPAAAQRLRGLPGRRLLTAREREARGEPSRGGACGGGGSGAGSAVTPGAAAPPANACPCSRRRCWRACGGSCTAATFGSG